MEIPRWADEQLSRDLPVLRAQGEWQQLEFIEVFPQNIQNLAKEIAAFATSNQGTILIGVSDSGDLVGIDEASISEERDSLLKRLEGICRGTVKPAITPVAKFALEDEKVVLVVSVPNGRQPVYYSRNIPYVRHLTESRPAEPHEILELVTEYLASQSIVEDTSIADKRAQFYSNLASTLGEALIYAEQTSDREINPWLDQWRAEFGYAAQELRAFSVQDIAIEDSIAQPLREISDTLNEVASLRLTLGCGAKLSRLTTQALECLIVFKEKKIDSIQLSSESLKNVRETIVITGRKLHDLVSRANEMVESGRIEELQAEASDFGHDLLRLAQYNITPLGEGVRSELTTVGRELHLVETMRLYMDGGRSMQAIVDRISSSNDALSNIIKKLEEP